MRKTSQCCKARLLFESIAGVIVTWRDVNGRKVYSAKCEHCKRRYDVDGGSSHGK